MAADHDLRRRVTRLENETESIYELITEIKVTQQTHTRRFDKIDGRLDGVDKRFDAMDGRFDAMDGRFDAMHGHLDASDGRFGRIETTLTEVLRRLPEPS